MRNTCIHCDSHGYMNYVYSLPWSQIYKLRALNAVATDILTSTFITVGTDIPNVCFHELGVFTAIVTHKQTTCIKCRNHGYTTYIHCYRHGYTNYVFSLP